MINVQDNAFRLPALKLQPKEYRFHWSQEHLDQSKETKVSNNTFNHYNPSPVRSRNKIMSMSVYNSQDKMKAQNESQFFQNSDFITCQNTNNNMSSVQKTNRRYRNQLKKLISNNNNKNEINSRDPRYMFFKEPISTIKLGNLNENSKNVDKLLEQKIKSLMSKVQLLLSTQSFYQEQKSQESININMVKLQDEYDFLYQNFNEFYQTNKKLDEQARKLLNHMQIIKSLLKPLQKPYFKYVKQSNSLHHGLFDIVLEETQESATQRIETNKQNIILFQDQNDIEIQSDNKDNFDNIISESQDSDTSPLKQNKQFRRSQNKNKKKNNKQNEQRQQKINENETQQQQQQNQEDTLFNNSIIISQNKSRKSFINIIDHSNEIEGIEDSTQNLTNQNNEQISINNNKKNNQFNRKKQFVISEQQYGYIENQQIQNSQNNILIIEQQEQIIQNSISSQSQRIQNNKKNIKIQDQSEINNQQDANIDLHIQNLNILSDSEIESYREQKQIIEHPNHQLQCISLLDRFIELDNVYEYKFLQNWNYHINKIKRAYFFDEFDL